LIIELIHLKMCRCIYRIISKIILGKYKCGIILQLIIELIHLKMCRCIYRIISKII